MAEPSIQTPQASSVSASNEKKKFPRLGGEVRFQEGEMSRPAIVADIDRKKDILTLKVLGRNGIDRAISGVQRDTDPNAEIANRGFWRFLKDDEK